MIIKLENDVAVEFFNTCYHYLFVGRYKISNPSDVSSSSCLRFQNGCFTDMQIRNSKMLLKVNRQ